jgi:hypothetical protein
MDKDRLTELEELLTIATAGMTSHSGEQAAPTASVEAAQRLGCELATGATFTKLIAAIEAEIAKLHTDV